jgi:uncharacterized protein YdhG (YjbR/CyaY superfamily)
VKSYKDIDEYIADAPEEMQSMLKVLRKTIKEEIPGVEESMSYKMPTFNLNGKYVVYFAAWKNHISLYPFSSDMEKIFPEAKKYKTSGKGTIQFPLDQALPLPFIRKIVKFLVKKLKS